MITAPIQCDVDGIPKGSHPESLPRSRLDRKFCARPSRLDKGRDARKWVPGSLRRAVHEQSIPQNLNPCYIDFLGISTYGMLGVETRIEKGFQAMGRYRLAGAAEIFYLNRL
jgi:hypothetical protein